LFFSIDQSAFSGFEDPALRPGVGFSTVSLLAETRRDPAHSQNEN
jgi:hypothetical protein